MNMNRQRMRLIVGCMAFIAMVSALAGPVFAQDGAISGSILPTPLGVTTSCPINGLSPSVGRRENGSAKQGVRELQPTLGCGFSRFLRPPAVSGPPAPPGHERTQ